MKQSRQIFLFITFALSLHSCSYIFQAQAIESWHQLRAAGDVAFYKHDYATAQKSFQEASKIAQSIHDQPVRLAVALEDLSKVCLATNDIEQATEICNQALELANKRSQAPKKQLEQIEESLGVCLNNVGQVFAKSKKYDQAAIAYRQARVLFVESYKRTSLAVSNFIIGSYIAWTIDGLGTSYQELGQLKQARQAYLSVRHYNIISGLSMELKEKLLADFAQIPDTGKEEKDKFASLLGCSLAQ